jgi:hypothetical protein
MQATIAYLRGIGFTGVIKLNPIAWSNSGAGGAGYDATNYATITAYDATLLGENNSLLCKHDYANEYTLPFTDAQWQGAVGGSQTLYVIDETEVGNYNGAGTTNAAWSLAIINDLVTKHSTMPNYCGGDAFAIWSDANALTSGGYTTASNPWGQDVYNAYTGTSGAAPVNTTAPVISGSTVEGEVLTLTSEGIWSNDPTLTNQWMHQDTDTNIAGATGNVYTTVSSDVGHDIRVAVLGENSYGEATAYSNTIGPITSGGGSPMPTPNVSVGALIFDDEFDGVTPVFPGDTMTAGLDTTIWCPYWFANGDTQNGTSMVEANVKVEASGANGVTGTHLNLITSGGAGAQGGFINTRPENAGSSQPGFGFYTGYAEAKLWLPEAGGAIANWPAWWLGSTNDGSATLPNTEIDIIEGLSGNAAWHVWANDNDPVIGDGSGTNPPYYGAWHTFGVYWTSTEATFYYDTVNVGSVSSIQFSEAYAGNMFLLVENSSGTYGGTYLACTVLCDYVRIWAL